MTQSALAYQATCVAIGGRAVLIEGEPGSGKSSLALALIDRGAELVGDDGIMLAAGDGRLRAEPHPATRGQIEIRNLGLIEMPACAGATVCLVLLLDREAPRFIERPETVLRVGLPVPCVRLWPDSPVLHLRAEQALARYGLPA
jgi:hypothetical protein